MLRCPTAGTADPVPAGAAKATVGPLDRVGVWSVVAAVRAQVEEGEVGRARRRVAVNLADRRESDLQAGRGIAERPASLAAGLAVRPIWYYLLASAWILTCWEWFLYQRRWID